MVPSRIATKFWHLVILAAFVAILRWPYFNSPAIHIDEQFYLALADKWINGGLVPYVDVWDRKPIGIFAIYAVAIVAFKNAILGYQIIAAFFVVATGAIIMRIGRRLDDRRIPFFAAAIYAVAVMLMDGPGGQTPIFYNLPVTIAVAIILRPISDEEPLSQCRVTLRAFAACLLFGLAMQIQYTCVVEAVALSLYLLVTIWHRGVLKVQGLAVLAGGMAFCGLLPTLLVGATYAAIGHWHEFFAANFESIFTKVLWRLNAQEYARRFLESSSFGVAFLPFAAYGVWLIFFDRRSQERAVALRMIALWILAAFAGAIMLGIPERHYFLPTLAPLALLTSFGFLRFTERMNVAGRCAAVLRHGLHGYGGLAALLVLPVTASYLIADINALQRGEPADIYAIGAYMKAHKTQGCPFVFNRLPILYYLGDACAPSTYMFPNHLSEIGEVRTPGGERLK
ncbi:MAG: hypothetical protein EPO08_17675, partial [Rhodospirillaceae bacterium]